MRTYVLIFTILVTALLSATDYVDTGAGISPAYNSSAAWGDYDNDGDLDFALCGLDVSNVRLFKLYRNDNNLFTDIATSITPVSYGSLAWGDYDRDGDLDLLITGQAASGLTTKIYRNDSSSFVDINAGLPGVYFSSAVWGDYDNDGDLDILLAGASSTASPYTPIAKIYSNTGGVFSSAVDLTGVRSCSASFCDIDIDGDLDILLTGATTATSPYGVTLKQYRNDNGTYVDASATITGVYNSSHAWGDYDGDGDLDLLMAGNTGTVSQTKLYRNDKGVLVDSEMPFTGAVYPSVAWGDYDNDGDYDAIVSGSYISAVYTKIYGNNGGVLSEVPSSLDNLMRGTTAFGDYDNDGDLDLLVFGTTTTDSSVRIGKIYRNDNTALNARPSAPTNLRRIVSGSYTILQWDAQPDDHTTCDTQTYMLRIGTSPGACDVSAPSSLNSGIRKTAGLGYALGNTSWRVKNTAIPASNTYYWSVQAIDGAFKGSQFSPESAIAPIYVSFPNGGETWKANESRSIYWTRNPNIANVNIYISQDNGANWTLLNPSPISAALGMYTFTVPSVVSSQCLMKVASSTTPSIMDISDSVFSIGSSDIANIVLTSQDTANLILIAGKTVNVTWTSSLVENVRLDVSYDGGQLWSSVVASTPAALGSYAWVVPDVLSETCYLRISDAANPSVYDLNNVLFKIIRLRLTSPNGGELFQRGQTKPITWISSTSAYVRLQYSNDAGTTWSTIGSSVPGNQFLVNWTISSSSIPSNQYLVKISLASDASVFDSSDASFIVSALDIVFPSASGLRIQTGKECEITWTQQQLTTPLKLEYTLDGSNYFVIAEDIAPDSLSYTWLVPVVTTSTGRIKVSLMEDPSISDISNNDFAICSLSLTYPNTAEVFTTATVQTIRWTSANIVNVRLDYSINNGSTWVTISSSVAASTGQYNWTIPNLTSYECLVRVRDTAATNVVDYSDVVFTIRPPIIVTAPNGGENLTVGSQYNITWSVTSVVSFILIDYSINNGSTWTAVVSSAYPAGLGSYSWTVPPTVSNNCRVRVKNSADSAMNDTSDNMFTITPTIFPPIPQFTADVTEGLEPLTVQFTDQSTPGSGSITDWLWSFGDEATSIEQNPQHTYNSPGVYAVSLTVTNVYDSTATLIRENYITVNSNEPMIALLTPSSLSFPDVMIGITSAPQQVRLQNIGLVNLTIQDFSVSNPDVFLISQERSRSTILPGATETLLISYKPKVLSTVSDTLVILNSSTNLPIIEIPLSGNGAALRVPAQFATIQAAIDAAEEGNCVLVDDGVYYENLQIVGKEIILASNYFADGDTLHVHNTIVDGSQVRNPDQASVLAILPGSNPYRAPRIIGFTLRNGSGWKVYETIGGSVVEKRVGGGIYIKQSNPVFTQNIVKDNDADDEGGGSYAFQSLPNLGGINPDGSINPGGNVFFSNHADIGKDIYINASHTRDEIKAENCKFEVFCTVDTTLSAYWATTTNPVKYDGSEGEREAINADLYVATNGNNVINTGLTPDSPFKSIDYALSLAYGTADNPITIHIASGIYSLDFTGEQFPLQMVDYVSLQGNGMENTVIDAGANTVFPTRVITCDNVVGVQIRDITLLNGYVTNTKNLNGGGLASFDSYVTLQRVAVNNSFSAGDGAGIYAHNSHVICDSLSIEYNQATGSGGGIYSDTTDLTISNSVFSHNFTSKYGGGLFHNTGDLLIQNSRIQNNNANGIQMRGGGICLSGTSSPCLINNVVSSNSGYNGGGMSLQNCTGIILSNNKITNNIATNWGGALYHITTTGNLYNNLIANNTASQRGGAFYSNSSLNVKNCTISNNRAFSQGGAVYVINASPSFHNSILWSNSAPLGGEVYLYDNSMPGFNFCDVDGGTAAFGLNSGVTYGGTYSNNLDADPMFTAPTSSFGMSYDALSADWTLSEGSPCINSGDPSTDTASFPLDLNGSIRIVGPRIDIGAYEAIGADYAYIVANPTSSVSFGEMTLDSGSVVREIYLSNTGTIPLIISAIEFLETNELFTCIYDSIDTEILPGDTAIITISFDPSVLGNHQNSLIIINNSINTPELVISLSALVTDEIIIHQGIITIRINGFNAVLSWSPITQDDQGNPFDPDTYLVLYSENASSREDDFFFHGATPDTTYTHYDVARYRNRMFYRVVGVNSEVRKAIADFDNNLKTPITLKQIKDHLWALRPEVEVNKR